jgi:hypothetical protein
LLLPLAAAAAAAAALFMAAPQVLASFPAETKSLTELAPELEKIARNHHKMGAAYEQVRVYACRPLSTQDAGFMM